MKKFRVDRSLAPILAFSKWLDTRICPYHNDTSEDLSEKYNCKHLLLIKWKNSKVSKYFWLCLFHIIHIIFLQ